MQAASLLLTCAIFLLSALVWFGPPIILVACGAIMARKRRAQITYVRAIQGTSAWLLGVFWAVIGFAFLAFNILVAYVLVSESPLLDPLFRGLYWTH